MQQTRRYKCGKDKVGHWRILEMVRVGGRWFIYQHWCFNSYPEMLSAIQDYPMG